MKSYFDNNFSFGQRELIQFLSAKLLLDKCFYRLIERWRLSFWLVFFQLELHRFISVVWNEVLFEKSTSINTIVGVNMYRAATKPTKFKSFQQDNIIVVFVLMKF